MWARRFGVIILRFIFLAGLLGLATRQDKRRLAAADQLQINLGKQLRIEQGAMFGAF